MRVYQILGRRSQLVTFPNGDDKVLPARTVFQARSSNTSVKRLMRTKPPACRELKGEEIPDEFKATKDDIYVVMDGE